MRANNIKFPNNVRVPHTEAMRDIIRKLLNPDRTRRLGAGKDGIQEIIGHEWFADIDLEKLMRLEIEAPFKPPPFGSKASKKYQKFDEIPESFRESEL